MKKYVLFSIMLLLGALVFSTPVVAKFEKIPHEKTFVKKAVESVSVVASFDVSEGVEHAPPLIYEASCTANISTTYNFTSEKLISETPKSITIMRQAYNSWLVKEKTIYKISYQKPNKVISNYCYHLKV